MLDVLVIGAGPTGLLMAAECARRNLKCRIVDKDTGPAAQSRALAIQPRTLELFDLLGIVEEFLSKGLKVHAVNPYSGKNRLAHITFEKLASDYPFVLSLEQSETEKILTHYLSGFGISVERETEAVDLRQQPDRIVAILRHLGKEEIVQAKWAVGCDGAHSLARKAIGVPFDGKPFHNLFSLADVRIDWDFPRDELFLFLDGDGILGAIPMPGQNRYRLVFQSGQEEHFQRSDIPGVIEKSGIGQGGSSDFLAGARDIARGKDRSEDEKYEAKPMPRQNRFFNHERYNGPTLEEVQAKVWKKIGKEVRVSDPVWLADFHINSRLVKEYRKGKIFLAGDAAHIHSPAGGQGMNSGLQDAFNLAWKLADGREKLLDTYNLERRSWGRDLVRTTRWVTNLATLRNPAAIFLRNWAIAHFAPHSQSHLFRAISQTAIRYPKSIIASESGFFRNGPRSGTRAPNASAGQTDLYSLFRKTTGWHLLLFGDFETVEPSRFIIHRIDDPKAKEIYGVEDQAAYLIRPDQYIAFRCTNSQSLNNYLSSLFE